MNLQAITPAEIELTTAGDIMNPRTMALVRAARKSKARARDHQSVGWFWIIPGLLAVLYLCLTNFGSLYAAEIDTSASAAREHDSLIIRANEMLKSKEFSEVESAMREYIQRVEDKDSRYSLLLAEPLLLLGSAREQQGDAIEALELYGRSLHVRRVNQGLHTPDQIPAVYKEAYTLATIGNYQAANEKHEYAYNILRRNHGALSTELLPGLFRLAEWYDLTHNIYTARALYEHALMIMKESYGDSDSRLIRAYTGLADSYKLERFPPYQHNQSRQVVGASVSAGGATSPSTAPQHRPQVHRYSQGEQALQEIIRIVKADSNSTSADKALRVLDLADWNLLFDKIRRAITLYEHAQELFAEDADANQSVIAENFSRTVELYMPLPLDPPPRKGDSSQEALDGVVEVSYVVDERGHAQEVTNTFSEPEGIMDTRVRRAVRISRFRPLFENGVAVRSPTKTLRHEFRYFPRTKFRSNRSGAGDAAAKPDTDLQKVKN